MRKMIISIQRVMELALRKIITFTIKTTKLILWVAAIVIAPFIGPALWASFDYELAIVLSGVLFLLGAILWLYGSVRKARSN